MAVTKLNLNNKIINGAFDYWQRNTTFTSIADATYHADRFRYDKSGAMVHTISRSTDVPTSSLSTYSLLVDCTTIDAAIAAGEYCFISQLIEGNMLRSFKGKNMVLSFWVKATKTGTYCIALRNAAVNRSLIKEYTVDTSNTWEKKTIRFTHDTAGAWLYDTGLGMYISWMLAAGSTFQTANANVWQTGNFLATTNQVNACDNAANNFQLADICLVEDNEGQTRTPDFVYAGRDNFEELQLCRRYYEISSSREHGPTNNSGTAAYVSANIQFQSEKRVNATVVMYDLVGAVNRFSLLTAGGLVNSANGLTPQSIVPSTKDFFAYLAPNSATFPVYTWTADAEL